MSGGSYNYVYQYIQDIELRHLTPERIAFQKHLKLVAAAMKAIEWVDSGDKSPGDESESIRKCISSASVTEALIEQAEAVIGQLREEMASNVARDDAQICRACGGKWLASTSDTTGCCEVERARARYARKARP